MINMNCWLLYQKKEVNMTEIAEYIRVPLNTATGIVGRLEKNGMIVRTRSKEDKRVVLIQFSEKGMAQFQTLFQQITYYGMKVLGSLTAEEMELFRLFNPTASEAEIQAYYNKSRKEK